MNSVIKLISSVVEAMVNWNNKKEHIVVFFCDRKSGFQLNFYKLKYKYVFFNPQLQVNSVFISKLISYWA